MGLGTGLARIILFVFTICFFLLGIAFVAGGLWLLIDQGKLFNLLNLINSQVGNKDVEGQLQDISQQKGIVQTAAILMIGVGAITIIISFFGCFGAIRESKCMLWVFAVFIFVILGCQVAAGVMIILYRGTITRQARNALGKLQDRYLISVNDFVKGAKQPHTSVSLVLNYMFVYGECCGANSSLDAANSKSWKASNLTWESGSQMRIPAACCKATKEGKSLLLQAKWQDIRFALNDRDCPKSPNSGDAHKQTCIDAIEKFIRTYSLWVIIGCAGLAGIQLLVIIFTICLICAIDD